MLVELIEHAIELCGKLRAHVCKKPGSVGSLSAKPANQRQASILQIPSSQRAAVPGLQL